MPRTANPPTSGDVTIRLARPHAAQEQVLREARRFNVVVCGRRWGKTILGTNLDIEPALAGKPVAWFAPTYKMLYEVWRDLTRRLAPITLSSNASEHRIDLVTGGVVDMWSLDSPDVARGRKYARAVIDEAAMVPVLQEAWEQVIRPTLADHQGDAWFLSTPKGFNYYHALYQQGQSDTYPDWASWQMPTHTNPYITPAELAALEREQPTRVYRQEILALFEAENEGALWLREWIDSTRVTLAAAPDLVRLVVAIDPSGSKRGDDVGIIVAGVDAEGEAYIVDDLSGKFGPDEWARRALVAYEGRHADRIVAEANFGGEMVQATIEAAARDLGIRAPVTLVHASRGKAVRAEPYAVLYKQGRVHHVGVHNDLENELCMWTPVDPHSPGRLDALVWALTHLVEADLPFGWLRRDPDFRAATLGTSSEVVTATGQVKSFSWLDDPSQQMPDTAPPQHETTEQRIARRRREAGL